jgi:hypothetical protein
VLSTSGGRPACAGFDEYITETHTQAFWPTHIPRKKTTNKKERQAPQKKTPAMKRMPWAEKTLLAAILVTSCLLNTAVGQSTGYSDFSMDEFFDIKRTIGRLKVRKTARALVAARSAVKLLQLTAPQKLVFHGQDHYQQTFDDSGKESWFHVGRPVRFLRSLLPCPRSSGPMSLFFWL